MSPGRLFVIVLACFALGAVLMALGSRNQPASVRRARAVKFGVYFLIVHVVLGCAVLGTHWLIGFAAVVLGLGARELLVALRHIRARSAAPSWPIAGGYVLLASGLLASVHGLAPARVAFLYVVVAAFDGFSQVFGQWLGRHALAPRLSPGKTVEGLAGGAAAAAAIGALLHALAGVGPTVAAIAALAIVPCALAGGMAASWVKRSAGIKDFGRLLPQHGGVLDRFDGLLGAGGLLAPLICWYRL